MSLLKKIGKGIGKAAKSVGKVAGGVLKTAAPIVSIVPGIGTLVGGAASVVGELISPTKQAQIEQAVQRDNVVEVHKIEQTIQAQNPSVNPFELKQATHEMTKQALQAVPTAKINDTQSMTEISTSVKIMQFVKSNIVVLGLGVIGVLAVFSMNKGKKKSSFRKR